MQKPGQNLKTLSLPGLARVICEGSANGRHDAGYLFGDALRNGRDANEIEGGQTAMEVFTSYIALPDSAQASFFELVRWGAELSNKVLGLIGEATASAGNGVWMTTHAWNTRRRKMGPDDICQRTTPIHLALDHAPTQAFRRIHALLSMQGNTGEAVRHCWHEWLDEPRSGDGARSIDLFLDVAGEMDDQAFEEDGRRRVRETLKAHLEGAPHRDFTGAGALARWSVARQRALLDDPLLFEPVRGKLEAALAEYRMEQTTARVPTAGKARRL